MFKFEDVSLFNIGQMINFTNLLCGSVDKTLEGLDNTNSQLVSQCMTMQLPNHLYVRYSEGSTRVLESLKDFLKKESPKATVKTTLGKPFLAMHLNLDVHENDILDVLVGDRGTSVILRSSLHRRIIVLEVSKSPVPYRLL